jgi:hypothetical protein
MSKSDQESDTYSEAETKARMQSALKRALHTPPKKHRPSGTEQKRSRESGD